MRRTILFTVLILLTVSGVFAQQSLVDEHFDRGEMFNDQGDWDAAILAFSEAIRLKPDFADAYAMRGYAYHRSGDNGLAIDDYTQAIRLNPDNSGFWYNRGIAHREKGDIDASIEDLLQAEELGYTPQTGNVALIPGGTFIMGSPADEPRRKSDEVQHEVTLSPFYMGRCEVTQEEYEEVMGYNPSARKGYSKYKGVSNSVEKVSWYDAVEYCNRRSEWEGLTPAYTINGEDITWNRDANGYRLPTEAEWEYACRAGTTTAFNRGNNVEQTIGQIEAGVSIEPNQWGLYNMNANVWEWCWDWLDFYSDEAQIDPAGALSGEARVIRGRNSYMGYVGFHIRSADRIGASPSHSDSILGFRVVRNGE